MARYRRMTALRPVNRIKHVFDSAATIAAGTTHIFTLASATDTPTLAVTNSVETGSKINGFYIKLVLASNEATVAGAIPNIYMALFKNVGGNLTAVIPNAVGANDNKRFVIHQEMSMIQNVISSNPTTLFNGVVAIPKGYRRNAPGDVWQLLVLCPQIDVSMCTQTHYKEFR